MEPGLSSGAESALQGQFCAKGHIINPPLAQKHSRNAIYAPGLTRETAGEDWERPGKEGDRREGGESMWKEDRLGGTGGRKKD